MTFGSGYKSAPMSIRYPATIEKQQAKQESDGCHGFAGCVDQRQSKHSRLNRSERPGWLFYLALSETSAMARSSNFLACQNWQVRIDAPPSSGAEIAQFCELQKISVASSIHSKRKLAASNESDTQRHGAVHPSLFQQLSAKPALPDPPRIGRHGTNGTVPRKDTAARGADR